MTYEEYEEMKIQEAVEIAQGILDGKVKTIPFEEAMKIWNETVRKIEEENSNILEKEKRNVV